MFRTSRCASGWLRGVALGLVVALAGGAAAEEGAALYRDGHYERAVAVWRAAASEGDAEAAWRLAVALNDGIVVPRDAVEAVRWLEQAAAAGHVEAQVDLGTAYDRGRGVDPSLEHAARWYRRAAEQGHFAAQYNYASMCEQGQGVDRDPVEAYAWYALALREGIGALGDAAIERVGRALGEAARRSALERARRYEAAYRPGAGAASEAIGAP